MLLCLPFTDGALKGHFGKVDLEDPPLSVAVKVLCLQHVREVDFLGIEGCEVSISVRCNDDSRVASLDPKRTYFAIPTLYFLGEHPSLDIAHTNMCLTNHTSHKPYKWNFTAQKGKGDREKRTSDRARTRDLRSIAEFQPREPRRPAEILRPPPSLCTGHRCAAIQRCLRPAPRGWYCVLCDGSRLSGA